MRKILAVLMGLVVLGLTTYSIQSRETLLTEGSIVYLALAPVDPRSIMQGDYMRLSFEAARHIEKEDSDLDGHIVLKVDKNKIGTFERLYTNEGLKDGEIKMRYRIRKNRVKFATNAFFFQEGTAKKYNLARYGEFRIDKTGDTILTGMRDKDLALMGVEL